MSLTFPHIRYIDVVNKITNDKEEHNRELWYIGTKYPVLTRLKKYKLSRFLYSPSAEIKYKKVWVVIDENNNVIQNGDSRLHVQLKQFTNNISGWRDKKIDDILK